MAMIGWPRSAEWEPPNATPMWGSWRAPGSSSPTAAASGGGGSHSIEWEQAVGVLQGTWANADCPSELYVVVGQHVTRTDANGSRHFTLHWDRCRQQLQWGTHGRLSLAWLADGTVAWIPCKRWARVWHWRRATPVSSAQPPPPWGPPLRTSVQSNQDSEDTCSSGCGPWRRAPQERVRAQPYTIRRSGWERDRERDRPRDRHRGVRRAGDTPRGSDARLPCGLLSSEIEDLLFREITPEDYELLCRLDEQVAAKNTASASSVKSLPTLRGDKVQEQECSVCLLPFEKDDVATSLPCGHSFHQGCIARWLSECRRTCPLCGKELSAS